MESMKGAASFRNPGKQLFLPPKSPFPNLAAPIYGGYGSAGFNGTPMQGDGYRHHQRTSSESFLFEEQPSWLDDLLDEPETSARRGTHRRSSSDSFACIESALVYANMDNSAQEECRAVRSITSWGSQELDTLKDARNYYLEGSLFGERSFNRQKNRVWEAAINKGSYSNAISAVKVKDMHSESSGLITMEQESLETCATEKKVEENPKDSKTCFEMKDTSQVKNSLSESDVKHVKQQFAQRSRVRKLQYITELERNVQALQAEGLEFSAELEFLDQQNIILNLENKALKQRLDSLAQEHLIKCLQQETLEREIVRLRLIFQQQRQTMPQLPPSHGRKNSRDLDSHFGKLSLKDANSQRDPVTGLWV